MMNLTRLVATMKFRNGLPANQRILREVISKAIIIAYREDVTKLVSSLTAEGFKVEVLRAEYTSEEMNYSKNSKTFVSHQKAWRKATETPDYTLICEADFVPCLGIGDFEVFWPLENSYAWGYLYQGSPRVLAVVGPERYLRGQAAPLVSYVVNATVASLMLKYFEIEKEMHDLRNYFTFDAHLRWYVMGLGGEAYMPRYHYGEHGGLPNPEHASLGSLGRDGCHRADNLMSRLHFLPQYAEGSYVSFLRTRLAAHLLGLARLATGRWISRTNVYHLRPLDVIKMYSIGLRRLISLPL
jgi:hypothetical protein